MFRAPIRPPRRCGACYSASRTFSLFLSITVVRIKLVRRTEAIYRARGGWSWVLATDLVIRAIDHWTPTGCVARFPIFTRQHIGHQMSQPFASGLPSLLCRP